MKRKTIAVCVTGYNWECESRIIFGIWEKCRENDINLLVFASFVRKPELSSDKTLPESIILGETEIYRLINYDLIDGIVMLGDSMISEELIDRIAENAGNKHIPIINVNDSNHIMDSNVLISDSLGMEYAVRHLVEEHGLKRINFIGGFPGNQQTEERLAAYKRVLEEHHITIEESRIAYGEFWKKAADCTESFLQTEPLPEAIVCASDTMAFFCMDKLKEHGLRIPEDIAVTGFDGIKDCEQYDPPLTTIRRDYAEMGRLAFDSIVGVWNGITPPKEQYVESKLVQNRSCGCSMPEETPDHDFYTKQYGELNLFREFNAYILDMNTKFACASTSAELYTDMVRGAQFFHLNRLYVCICSNVEYGSKGYDPDKERPKFIGLSDTMISMLKFGHDTPVGTPFATRSLVPDAILEEDKAVFFAFSPLYFKDTFLGYLAYEPTGIKGAGDFFATWVTSIANNAGSFYMKNELECVVTELENLYIRDPLTGLYNRRGMLRLGRSLMESARYHSESVTIICADIDGLKPINDIYGHEAGDNAILQTAYAIRRAMPEGSICVRTGGDEFCIIASIDEAQTAEYVAKIGKYLEEYNRTGEVPYTVGCSCGYYSISAGKLFTIDDMVKIADANMYAEKNKKKAGRI